MLLVTKDGRGRRRRKMIMRKTKDKDAGVRRPMRRLRKGESVSKTTRKKRAKNQQEIMKVVNDTKNILNKMEEIVEL